MFACQAKEVGGRELPRLVLDVEFLHDAQREYCERFQIDGRDVGLTKSTWRGYYWVECGETYNEDPDITTV
jgi:hypothetical protein